MKFNYQYRTSDNKPHRGVVCASSKEEAYQLLKSKGIKPGRVEEAPGFFNKLFGKGKRWLAIALLSVVAVASTAIAFMGSEAPAVDETETKWHVAVKMPRQEIAGDRDRIAAAQANAFTNVAERYLACFAEPGRWVELPPTPSAADFERVFGQPLKYAEKEFTEQIDLKRIVENVKWEMFVYLRAGGTVKDYLAQLVDRQKKEAEIRNMAEKHLYEMFKPSRIVQAVVSDDALRKAYEYWLRANANLQAMGIYQIRLPHELRRVQMEAVGVEDGERE